MFLCRHETKAIVSRKAPVPLLDIECLINLGGRQVICRHAAAVEKCPFLRREIQNLAGAHGKGWTSVCVWRRFSGGFARAHPGVTSRRIGVGGAVFSRGSGVGPKRVIVTYCQGVIRCVGGVDSVCRWPDHASASVGLRDPQGGLTRQVVALTDAVGHRIRFEILPGQTHDLKAVPALLDDLTCEMLMGDTAFGADGWLDTGAEHLTRL